jgi:hypothetical protein
LAPFRKLAKLSFLGIDKPPGLSMGMPSGLFFLFGPGAADMVWISAAPGFHVIGMGGKAYFNGKSYLTK